MTHHFTTLPTFYELYTLAENTPTEEHANIIRALLALLPTAVDDDEHEVYTDVYFAYGYVECELYPERYEDEDEE